jgi:hypothetical protein
MDIGRSRAIGAARVAVIVAIVGASAFGLYLGYLAYTNDSFPAQQKPFGEYASVVSSTFNGTEVYYKLQWTASNEFIPLFAQLTSPTSDAANSPVCALNLSAISRGQTFDLPFAIATPSTSISSVDLAIAVRSVTNGTEFTIVYHVDSFTAQPGKIQPSTYACEQPAGANM